jgi:hypothetical protein
VNDEHGGQFAGFGAFHDVQTFAGHAAGGVFDGSCGDLSPQGGGNEEE